MTSLFARIRLPLVVAAAASVLSVSALAQGRHDEKPHGMKEIEKKEMAEPRVHPGGRHDEAAHKAAIRASKKDAKGEAKARLEPTK